MSRLSKIVTQVSDIFPIDGIPSFDLMAPDRTQFSKINLYSLLVFQPTLLNS